MLNSIRSRLNLALVLMATVPLVLFSLAFAWRGVDSAQGQAIRFQGETAEKVAIQLESFITGLEREILVVEQTHGLSTMEPEHQQTVLTQLLAQQTAFDEITILNPAGQETVRLNRFRTVSEAQLATRAQEDEFTVPMHTGQSYYSSVHFAVETGEPLITIALPLRNLRTAEIVNILVADIRFKRIWDLLAQLSLDQEIAYIVDSSNLLVAHQNPSVVLRGTSLASLPDEDGISLGLTQEEVLIASRPVVLGEQQFTVVVERLRAEALAAAYYLSAIALGVIGLLALLAWGVSRLITNSIADPLQGLVGTAQEIQTGNLAARAELKGLIEVQTLARAVNSMADQLEQTLHSLETQVEERTRALQTSTEVSRRLSTILDQKELISEVVKEVRSAFNYYHAHIYLYNETKDKLVMAGGTGRAAQEMLERQHALDPGQGLVGEAGAANTIVLVPDVAQNEKWLPNPLLPDTKAEIAVPIAVGTDVLGVLDVQHNVAYGLTEEDSDLLQSVANQVAIALNNARFYEQVQNLAEREALINRINQQIQRATTVEDVLQVAAQELGQALGLAHTEIYLQSNNGRNQASTITVINDR
ncbi:MAG: cache domain-containing protein [Chloroflexota bacterium]